MAGAQGRQAESAPRRDGCRLTMGKAFESIKAGLTEAIAHAKGEKAGAGVRVYRPRAIDVRELR